MLFFGHTGITLGVAIVLANLPSCRVWISTHPRLPLLQSPVVPPHTMPPPPPSPPGPPPGPVRPSPFRYLVDLIDVRFLLIGAMLPDAIDKPLGHFIFPEALSNGRIYCHTLLFLILLFSLGMWLYRRSGRRWLLVLFFGVALHLVLDRIWLMPRTLFWPFYRLTFEKGDISDWLPGMVHSLLTEPSVFIPEIVGFFIIFAFTWWLVRRKKLVDFIRSGRA